MLLIVLIFFVPYGVDAAYDEGAFCLGVRLGPVRIGLYPLPRWLKKLLDRKKKGKKPAAAKPAEPKPEKPKTEPLDKTEKIPKKKKKPELDVETILALLKMGVHAIRRFFRSFTVDLFRLHLLVASRDPYNTARTYAAACALVEALPAMGGGVIRVRRRDVQIGSDFLSDKPRIKLRITVTLQLFRLVHLAAAFAAEFIAWKIKNRRTKKAAAASERKADNGRQQVQ